MQDSIITEGRCTATLAGTLRGTMEAIKSVGTINTFAPAEGHSWSLLLGRAAVAVFGLTAAFTAAAEQQTLYKSVLPSGDVGDADSSQPGAKRTDKLSVEPHLPDLQATQAAQRNLTTMRELLLRNVDARSARKQQLDRDMAGVSRQLQDAQARQEQGRRLLGPFWQRQQMHDNEVQRAQEALNALFTERAALQ